MARFDNNVVIITGASTGIGAATARAFVREGAAVATGVSSDIARATAIAADVEGVERATGGGPLAPVRLLDVCEVVG